MLPEEGPAQVLVARIAELVDRALVDQLLAGAPVRVVAGLAGHLTFAKRVARALV